MKQILTFSLLLLTTLLFAQPANDDCIGIVDLGVAPSCDTTLYNNIGATESNIGVDNFPTCFVGVPARDVWFQFTATPDFLNYRIEVTGCEDPALGIAAMRNPQIAIYRGDCEVDGLQQLKCASAQSGELSVLMDLIGLTPNITYYVRINDWTSTAVPNDGAFKICVKEKPPVSTIDQGGSTECSGTLADSGGEFGNYGNNENHQFTICPSAPHECILFTLEYYNIEYAGDQIFIYDGNSIAAPVIGSLNGQGFLFSTPSEGGVCFSTSASSGCLTVQFVSNSSVSFEGFLGHWECTSAACPPPAVFEVDTEIDQAQVVSSVISGQTLISLVEVNCPPGTVGTFTATDNTDLGMDKGLVLSSGSVTNIGQPAMEFESTLNCNLLCSDDDLNTLSVLYGNGEEARDACIVEMDVLAASDELTFEYVFGSEEYPEFIEDEFNDIFAFLVSGPGIVGDPNIGNKLNVATLPDGTFIQIQDVNLSSNWQYYRDNSFNQSIVYDGLTSDSLGVKKSLTARVPTIPCETYKLKFAIADRGDNAYDSGVFISKINSGTPELGTNFNNGIDYLVESCSAVPDEVVISFNNQIDLAQTYQISLGGTAVRGVDYDLLIPDSVVFQTGTEIFTFPITVISDTSVEGVETIIINLSHDFGCGPKIVSSITLNLHDLLDVDILGDVQDTVIICAAAGCIPMEVIGAETYSWSPDTLFSDATAANPNLCTNVSQWVYVEGTLGTCNDVDSVFVRVIDVQLNILPDTFTVQLCEGETLTVSTENNVNNQNLQWSAIFQNFPNPSAPEQVIIDTEGFGFESVTATIEIGGCIVEDFLSINWVTLDTPEVIADVVICQNSSVKLANDVETFTTTYTWTPDTALSPSANVSGPVATPEQTTTYTLISMAGSGGNICTDTSMVTVTVIPADVDIEPADTAFMCVGTSVTLTNTNTTNGVGVTWSPLDFLMVINSQEAVASPPVSQYYYATLTTPDCIVKDSVWVQVDSLPDLIITADPMKDSYCEGEEVYLLTPTYEPSNFPSIDLQWMPDQPGAQTPDSFLNLVIIALEDFTYIRTTTVNVCVSEDSIFIKVTPVTSITVLPQDTIVCQGDQVQFTIDGPAELTEFMWMPADGLSCTDCREPVATINQTVSYQVEAEFEGCPVGASVTVNVPAQLFQYTGPNPICPGTTIVLNNLNVPGATYLWTSSDGSLTSNLAQPTVAPTQTTTYNLVATQGDCVYQNSLTIEVLPAFSITVVPTGISCPGAPVTLTANPTPINHPGINYLWTNTVTGETFTGQTTLVSPLETANWQLQATDACMTNTVNFVVQVAPQFAVFGNPPVASAIAGQSVIFSADATTTGVTFTWQSGGAQVGTGPNFTTQSCEDTTYTLIGTDFNGCTASAAVQLDVDPLEVTATPPVATVVAGGTATFSAAANVTGTTFAWQNSAGQTIGTGPTLTVSSCTDQLYTVIGKNGVCPDSFTVQLTVLDGFSIDTFYIEKAQGDTTEMFYEGQEITLFVETTPTLIGATYTWLFVSNTTTDTLAVTNQPSSGTINLPEVQVDLPGNFMVLITTSDGCEQDTTLAGNILNNPVEAPNVFTPNGDNTNDRFTLISLVPVEIIEFRVWDRWGKMVYDNSDGEGAWDGTIDGKEAASDVYIYSISYRIFGSENAMKPLRGDLTLLR